MFFQHFLFIVYVRFIDARVKKLLTDGWFGKEIPNFTTLHCITYLPLKVILVLINFNMQMINRMFLCVMKKPYIHSH